MSKKKSAKKKTGADRVIYPKAWVILKGVNLWKMDYSALIDSIDRLFPKRKESQVYNFTIGFAGPGWSFNVTNSWQAWMDNGYDIHFRYYGSMRACLIAFLEYVIKNKIQPHKLYNHG